MRKNRIISAVLAVLLLSQSACFLGGNTATERFARGNQEIQILLQEADRALNELLDLNLISPDAVISATKWGMAINKAQEPIIVEALRYVQVKDGREVLVIDEVGRDRLLRLINSFKSVSTQIATTVNWPGLSSEASARLTAILSAIIPIATELATLAYKFKTVKSPPATLRSLLVSRRWIAPYCFAKQSSNASRYSRRTEQKREASRP